jgi:hypothetical protein
LKGRLSKEEEEEEEGKLRISTTELVEDWPAVTRKLGARSIVKWVCSKRTKDSRLTNRHLNTLSE